MRATDGTAARRCRDRNRRRLHEPDLLSPGRQRLYGLLDRIQDLGLHLISLDETGGTEAVPRLPLRAGLAHPGFPLRRPRDPNNPPVGSRGLAARCPGRRTRNAEAARAVRLLTGAGRVTGDHFGVNERQEG
jgi:hypothetical protein